MTKAMAAHGETLHQLILLGIILQHPDKTSSELAERYKNATGYEMAYNFQHMVFKRMAGRGLLTKRIPPARLATSAASRRHRLAGRLQVKTKYRRVAVWRITAKGKKLLEQAKPLARLICETDGGAVCP